MTAQNTSVSDLLALERFHAVLRLGKSHQVAAVSHIGRDRAASDRSILKHQHSVLPMIGRWRVLDYTPLIEELCGPMGKPARLNAGEGA